jgi:hypothetical protein
MKAGLATTAERLRDWAEYISDGPSQPEELAAALERECLAVPMLSMGLDAYGRSDDVVAAWIRDESAPFTTTTRAMLFEVDWANLAAAVRAVRREGGREIQDAVAPLDRAARIAESLLDEMEPLPGASPIPPLELMERAEAFKAV